MSNGRLEDLEHTLEGRTQTVFGKSWLRHREGTQAYMIDYMLLEGHYTLDDIAQVLIDNNLAPERQLAQVKARVKMHLEHLQEGHNYGQLSHGLRVLERANGELYFDVALHD